MICAGWYLLREMGWWCIPCIAVLTLLWAMMLNKSAYSVRLEERVAALKQVIHKSDAACLSAENYYQRHHRMGRL
jgi:hypothetical protein